MAGEIDRAGRGQVAAGGAERDRREVRLLAMVRALGSEIQSLRHDPASIERLAASGQFAFTLNYYAARGIKP